MKKSVYVLAILAAAVSTAAVAKDLKQDKKATVPTVAATRMSDAEMDKVTAGTIWNERAGRELNPHAFHACGHGPIVCY
jgi:hypothetical protein